MMVIPGEAEGSSMIFAKRQARAISQLGVDVRTFYLASRTNPFAVMKQIVQLRGALKDHGSHMVHAHFGTVTALSCSVCGLWPLVITFRGSDLNTVRSMPRIRS